MIAALEQLLLAAAKLETLLAQQGWRFCFIGGIAVQRWSNPRFTQDIDLTLLTTFGAKALARTQRRNRRAGQTGAKDRYSRTPLAGEA